LFPLLSETFVDPFTSITRKYYEPVPPELLAQHHDLIREVIETGLEDGEITGEEAVAMIPSEPRAGRLYGLAKDHKPFSKIPPFRPIISGCGSNTEYISKFVDHHANNLVRKIPSFLEDTPHLLRCFAELQTQYEYIPSDVIPVTLDVVGLYTNIPSDEGIAKFRAALDTRENQSVSTEFLITLLTLILKCNVFEFDGSLYIQEWGTAMGTHVAPPYANIFMGGLEEFLASDGAKYLKHIFAGFYKRFIDDIFLLWQGSREQLDEFISYMNSIHPTIKFSSSFDFEKREITFLDVSIRIEDGKIITDLFRKPTAAIQYLLPGSCHPPHITKNIPFSLGYRLLRICSHHTTFLKRLAELREMLIQREYRPRVIDAAFEKLKCLDRDVALQRVERRKNKTDKVTFVIKFDPRLPSVSQIVNKHFKIMKTDPHLNRVFASGVQVAYSRHKNLKDLLCKSTLYEIHKRPIRSLAGWHICMKRCIACVYSKNMNQFKCTATGKTYKIYQQIGCEDKNIIYVIQCKKCSAQYVGKTSGTFKARVNKHRNSIGQSNTNVAKHFEQSGHSVQDFFAYAIEKVRGDAFVLGTRERFWIDTMDVISHGMNCYRTF